jgi:hypothetical protein
MSITYETTILENGTTTTTVNGKLHSINDRPARVSANGLQEWYEHGLIHRVTRDESGQVLPAQIAASGSKWWYINDKYHRDDDLPAIVYASGQQMWYINGKQHRSTRDADGYTLPAEIWADGSKMWYRDDKEHRDDYDTKGNRLPAVIYSDGEQEWYDDGVKLKDPTDVLYQTHALQTYTCKIDGSDDPHNIEQYIIVYDDKPAVIYYEYNGIEFTLDISVYKLNDIQQWKIFKQDGKWNIEACVHGGVWVKAVLL